VKSKKKGIAVEERVEEGDVVEWCEGEGETGEGGRDVAGEE
jgi:hypothetical protein